MIGLEKSFRLMYSNTHLRTRETLPLSEGRAEMDNEGYREKIGDPYARQVK